MTMKKKIVIVALVVCIFAMSIASATLAYFTDEKSITNTFTVGNVEIKLDENVVKQDVTNGNYVANGTERTESGFDVPTSLFPMQNISKDPTITVTGSENAYIGAVITIKNGANKLANADVSKMLITGDNSTVDAKAVNVDAFLVGLIDANTATVKYKKVGTDVKVYVVVTAAQAKDAKVVLFNSVQINKDWNNAEMANLSDLEIVVEAYAVQTAGFAATDSLGVAEVAIKAAFPAEFADYFA